VPTKEIKRRARGLVEGLEFRVHAGPPVGEPEIQAARDFLRQNEFSSSSDYFGRLIRIQDRIVARPAVAPQGKRNYGGEAAGYWMQVQSIYDHVILSTCYDGEFNAQRGRVKISHRFNQAGRVDFVELKFLRSLQPCLNGAIRKLLTVCDYQDHRRDWFEAEAFALQVLPRELVFLCGDLFRYPRNEVLAWVVNLGHWIAEQLLADLKSRPVNGCGHHTNHVNGNGHNGHRANGEEASHHNGNGNGSHSNQLDLKAVLADEVARPILSQAAALTSVVELGDSDKVVLRYAHK
jgi:hypothetical protein